MAVWKYRGGALNLEGRTAVMGILNLTPDSFSDGGNYSTVQKAVERAVQIEKEGATLLDIGGQSTRPGYTPVSAEEEWQRLEPVLKALKGRVSLPISIDTYYPQVAEKALEMGAAIINDVSNSRENGMAGLCARHGAGLVMMHNDAGHNTPRQVNAYFKEALKMAGQAGLPADYVCLDPGIGFDKDRQEDVRLIASLPLVMEGLPDVALLVGASRKRVVGAFCGNPPFSQRLPGTLAVHTAAQLGGAHILRVHDVAPAVQAAAVTDAIRQEWQHG